MFVSNKSNIIIFMLIISLGESYSLCGMANETKSSWEKIKQSPYVPNLLAPLAGHAGLQAFRLIGDAGFGILNKFDKQLHPGIYLPLAIGIIGTGMFASTLPSLALTEIIRKQRESFYNLSRWQFYIPALIQGLSLGLPFAYYLAKKYKNLPGILAATLLVSNAGSFPAFVAGAISHQREQTWGGLFNEFTSEDRNKILDVIQKIAPSLYEEIIKVDPTGEAHIKPDDKGTFSITFSTIDGLPKIYIGKDVRKNPPSFIEAFIAHELGHYVSGHKRFQPMLKHKNLFPRGAHKVPTTSSSEKAIQTFHLARSRTMEFEADKSEILDFGIDVDIAIEAAKVLKEASGELQSQEPSKTTFKKTHPFWTDRIKHFEELRREAELRRAQGLGKTDFNWKQLAQDHLQYLKRGR